jgi:UDP-N-acetylglucosamine acyltransferase
MHPDEIYEPMSRYHESNNIHPTAIIYDNVTMGKNNTIRAGAIIGGDGEIRGLGPHEFHGSVDIGDGNSINEYVTIHRPASAAAVTKIGDNNIIMAHAHIGHDAVIGNNCEIASGSIIGGHAVIEDDVKIKLGVTVRNRKTIGKGSLVGLGSVVVADVEQGAVVVGNPAKPMNGPKMTMKFIVESEDNGRLDTSHRSQQNNLDDLNPNV